MGPETWSESIRSWQRGPGEQRRYDRHDCLAIGEPGRGCRRQSAARLDGPARAPRARAGVTDIGAYQIGPAVDTIAPTAALSASVVTVSNASMLNPYTFSITYADNLGIKKSSLAAIVVRVVPPGIGSPITATVVSTTAQGSTDAAGSYKLNATGSNVAAATTSPIGVTPAAALEFAMGTERWTRRQ